MGKVTRFLSEVKGEMSKVVWPSKREALKITGIVILFSLVVALFLGLIDFVLQRILELFV